MLMSFCLFQKVCGMPTLDNNFFFIPVGVLKPINISECFPAITGSVRRATRRLAAAVMFLPVSNTAMLLSFTLLPCKSSGS